MINRLSHGRLRRALAGHADARLIRNTAYNLLGQVLPAMIAIAAIPIMVRQLGVDSFGILALCWTILSYFTLFDLGLSRATVKFVAEASERHDPPALASLVWTSFAMAAGVGLIAAMILALLATWSGAGLLNPPAELRAQTRTALLLVAAATPAVVAATSARGVLEGQQRFGLLNAVRVPANCSIFLLPLLVLPFSTCLDALVGALALGQIAFSAAYVVLMVRALPSGVRTPRLRRPDARKLLGFGGWIAVSNVVGPLMLYLDRFVIGAALTAAAVAYYVTPYEIATKLWILPTSLLRVMFPMFCVAAGKGAGTLPALQRRANVYVAVLLVPAVALLLLFGRQFLALWLGGDFAAESTAILQILAIAVLVNSFGQVPLAVLQAAGRPDLAAKLHVVEFPVYAAVLLAGVATLGIEGAALAWLLRAVVDALILLWLASEVLRDRAPSSPVPALGVRHMGID